MKYYFIEPEVAGGLANNTVMNQDVHPPIVSKLHYEFDGWLGDVLLESFPCFIITETAKQKLQSIGATGIVIDQVEITKSGEFTDLHPNLQLPPFVWLRVIGKPGREDFGIAADGRLVISARALESLKELGLSNALISDFAD